MLYIPKCYNVKSDKLHIYSKMFSDTYTDSVCSLIYTSISSTFFAILFCFEFSKVQEVNSFLKSMCKPSENIMSIQRNPVVIFW